MIYYMQNILSHHYSSRSHVNRLNQMLGLNKKSLSLARSDLRNISEAAICNLYGRKPTSLLVNGTELSKTRSTDCNLLTVTND